MMMHGAEVLLDELAIDIDLSDIDRMSEHTIRTVEELLSDAVRFDSGIAAERESAKAGLSEEALAILSGDEVLVPAAPEGASESSDIRSTR